MNIELLEKVKKVKGSDETTKLFWFRIVAENGQVIATSEVYTTKAARTKTVTKFAAATNLTVAEPASVVSKKGDPMPLVVPPRTKKKA